MKAKEKNFIIVSLADKNSYGFDERTLPKLVSLVDSTAPAWRTLFNTGIVAYYLSSRRSLATVELLVKRAEDSASSDPNLASLGIGVSEGSLIAEFSWRGRLESMPLGAASNVAMTGARISGQSASTLQELRKMFT